MPTVFQPPSCIGGVTPWGVEWSARGVIESLEPLALARRVDRIRAVYAARLKSVTVVMDAPHDPHNGAAILRSCDAFGIQCLHVVERIEPFLVARKVAQGTERWVDIIRHSSAEQALSQLRAQSYALAVAHPLGELLPEDLNRIERLAVVMGNEHDGVCEQLTRAADYTVRVPMRGFVESLNVSVTTALLLEAAVRDRVGDLDAQEQEFLLARALLSTVPRAGEILKNLAPH
ncbi:MAG: TrmH family RNA methyltransferase [Myxococcales bacterium]